MKALIASLLAALSMSMAIAGPFEDGLVAYDRKDYATALKLWRPLAAQGNADAQFNLGSMYGGGRGVTQDYIEAVRWYKLAAAQGHVAAMYYLGMMYGRGLGVPQDYLRAHLWSNLAAAKGHEKAAKNRDIAAGKMTPQQIAEAQKMARECLAGGYKKCD